MGSYTLTFSSDLGALLTPSCAVLDLPGGLLASPRSIFSFAWDHLRLILGLLKASWSPLGSCRGAFGISWALLKIHLDSSSVSRPTIPSRRISGHPRGATRWICEQAWAAAKLGSATGEPLKTMEFECFPPWRSTEPQKEG